MKELKNKLNECPTEKGIFPPEGGWKEKTVYLVQVSMRPTNPVFKCLLHTGFIFKEGKYKGLFGGYCEIWANTCDQTDASKVYYLEPIQELCPLGD